MALGELLAVGAEDQWQVAEDGRFRAEPAVERDLLGCVADVVLATDHVGESHVHVVAHHREVVGGRPVGAQEHEVLHIRTVEGDAPLHGVVPGQIPVRDGTAHDEGLA